MGVLFPTLLPSWGLFPQTPHTITRVHWEPFGSPLGVLWESFGSLSRLLLLRQLLGAPAAIQALMVLMSTAASGCPFGIRVPIKHGPAPCSLWMR